MGKQFCMCMSCVFMYTYHMKNDGLEKGSETRGGVYKGLNNMVIFFHLSPFFGSGRKYICMALQIAALRECKRL